MITPIRRHLEVERDILELAAFIARDSHDAAFRFLDAVEETILSLSYMPGKGSPKHLHGRGLAGVRSWAIRGFPNHLILYDLRSDGVYILAVVQGSLRYSVLLRERTRGQ